MAVHSDYHGDRLLDSLTGRLMVLAIVVIAVAAFAVWTYVLW